MNITKALTVVLTLSVMLFAFSGCTAVLLILGANYFLGESTGPTVPTVPTEPSMPTAPTNPTEPTEATDPTEPTDPTEVTDPTEPTEPTESTEPTDPTEPEVTAPESTDAPLLFTTICETIL